MPPAGPLAICDPKVGPDCAIGARKYATTDLHPLWRANPSGIDIDRQSSRREVPDTVAVYQSGLPGAQRRSRSSIRKGGILPPWVADLTEWAGPAENGAARQPEWVRGFRGFSLGSLRLLRLPAGCGSVVGNRACDPLPGTRSKVSQSGDTCRPTEWAFHEL